MHNKIKLPFYSAILITFLSASCSVQQEWPDSPLYSFPDSDPLWVQPLSRDEAMKAISGHYAHYDVVAYEDVTTKTPMKTFVISYGFTDFYIEDGKLYQVDRFCHAEQKINQKFVTSSFSDEAVQAIEPRVQEVELKFENGKWNLYRPATPTLLGITGDPNQPLSKDREDPRLTDPDNDGNPGVTVQLTIGGFIKGEIYITRREIFKNYLTLHSNGNLYGYIEDLSEQFVVDANMKILKQQSNSLQIPDRGMNPIMLIRIANEINSCEELKANRDKLFPPEPEFVYSKRK